MLSARLCQISCGKALPIFKTSFSLRPPNLIKTPQIRKDVVRQFMENKQRTSHVYRRQLLQEQIYAPAGETAFTIGRGAVAGSALFGLGALCYYGLGLSTKTGALEEAVFWPQYVRDRINATYSYFGGSILISVASAAAVFKTPAALEFFARGGLMTALVTIGAMFASGILVQSIPYSPGFGPKQLAWIGHSAIIGAAVAPLAVVGGPILLRAAWYTAGIVGGLSTIAMCAPSEKFLHMGGPLAIGLGVIFASSLGSLFLPPHTVMGAGLHSLALYGGLILFSGFILYDTQKIIYAAEKHPPNFSGVRPYDPVNMSLSLYLDVINIFIRVVTILSGGGTNKKH